MGLGTCGLGALAGVKARVRTSVEGITRGLGLGSRSGVGESGAGAKGESGAGAMGESGAGAKGESGAGARLLQPCEELRGHPGVEELLATPRLVRGGGGE